MWVTNKQKSGFTIVELLIVIVVIAILAAISIVAYNGIQNRTNDAVIQSDIAQVSKRIELYKAETGSYPTSAVVSGGTLEIKASKSSYSLTSTNARNLGICTVLAPGAEKFAVLALSKSGKWFYKTNSGPITQGSTGWTGNVGQCADFGILNTETGFWGLWGAEAGQVGGWYPWVKS
jgi:prepilin-type N-terminal cleavage/methylation domain-containing protein